MLQQMLLGVLPALAQPRVAKGIEGAGLLDDIPLHRKVQNVAYLAYSMIEHDIELSHAERRRHLVFHHPGPDAVAYHLGAVLDGVHSPQVNANGAVEL